MSQCATCGFDLPRDTFGICIRCVEHRGLVESRREAMRAWLDRGLTPRPRWWRPGDPEWLPVNARTWRDFEGAEGAQESTQANGNGPNSNDDASGMGSAGVASETPNGDKLNP